MNDTIESELSPAFCNMLWQALRATLAARRAARCVSARAPLRPQPAASNGGCCWRSTCCSRRSPSGCFSIPSARLDDSGLRILVATGEGLAAGVVLLAGCVLVFRKRAGIVLLHAGVALLMFSELWTGLTANEAQMTIAEGETANYASDIRTDRAGRDRPLGSEHDRVTVVPAVAAREQRRRGRADRARRPAVHDPGAPLAAEFVASRRRRPASRIPPPPAAGRQLVADEVRRGDRRRHASKRRFPGRLRRAVLERRLASRSARTCSAPELNDAAGRSRRQDVRPRAAATSGSTIPSRSR